MSISLITATTINHELTELAINKSCEAKKFDEILVFSNKPLPKLKYDYTYYDIEKDLNIRTIDGEPLIFNLSLYQEFLFRFLINYVNTEHIISIHYDGFCVNEDEWTDEFLEYDYIGSPTHRKWGPLSNTLKTHDLYDKQDNVWYTGGGGCSLRSKKLLQALQDPKFDLFLSDKNQERCEDYKIAVTYKDYLINEYGIKFAPLDIALKFSTELLTGCDFSFGFHGWDNTPLFLSEDEVIFFIEKLNRNDISISHIIGRRFLANCFVRDYQKAIQCFLEKTQSNTVYSYTR